MQVFILPGLSGQGHVRSFAAEIPSLASSLDPVHTTGLDTGGSAFDHKIYDWGILILGFDKEKNSTKVVLKLST